MPRANSKFGIDEAILALSDGIKENAFAPNIKKYIPHEKQRVFHSSDHHGKLYIGGNRSGKTTGGVTEGIWRALGTHPYRLELNNLGPTRGRVVGVDFQKGVKAIILPQYKQWLYPSALINGSWTDSWDASTWTLTLSNGSTIEFMSYDQDLDKFAGTSRHWIHFDEEPPQKIWGECRSRRSDTEGDYWITMTPVEGMTWIYDDLYEKNHEKEQSEQKVLIIEINTTENPYLTENAIKQFVDTLDDDEDVTVRIGGGFVRKGGLVYPNFDPTPGKKQVLDQPILDPNEMFPRNEWLWIMGLDHGLNNPTAVLWTAWNKAGFGIIFDEWYQKDLTVDQHAIKIKQRIRKHGRMPDLMVADPSIKNRNGISGTSVHQEYQKYGLPFILGNNDVKSGIIRVRKYLNPAPYNSAYRGELFKGFEDFCKLRIAPNCTNTIWEAKRYRWKTYSNKQLQYENNPYDEPHKKDDHAMDTLRYIIMQRPDLLKVSDDTARTEVDDAMEELTGKLRRYDKNTDNRDDPHNRLDSPAAAVGGFDPNVHTSSPASDDWEYDEHMGGYY
jgi:phage terminase large subunit-like protein